MDQLPMQLHEWAHANHPSNNMLFRECLSAQLNTIFGQVVPLLFVRGNYCEVAVIATHRSKSIDFPVMEITATAFGSGLPWVRLTLRDNTFDWKVSVESAVPLNITPKDLFDPTVAHASCYCEGFPASRVFDAYAQNHSRFTVEISSSKNLVAFVEQIASFEPAGVPGVPITKTEV